MRKVFFTSLVCCVLVFSDSAFGQYGRYGRLSIVDNISSGYGYYYEDIPVPWDYYGYGGVFGRRTSIRFQSYGFGYYPYGFGYGRRAFVGNMVGLGVGFLDSERERSHERNMAGDYYAYRDRQEGRFYSHRERMEQIRRGDCKRIRGELYCRVP